MLIIASQSVPECTVLIPPSNICNNNYSYCLLILVLLLTRSNQVWLSLLVVSQFTLAVPSCRRLKLYRTFPSTIVSEGSGYLFSFYPRNLLRAFLVKEWTRHLFIFWMRFFFNIYVSSQLSNISVYWIKKISFFESIEFKNFS